MYFATNKKEIITCPKCGGPVTWYHDQESSKAVCRKKCQGWIVIKKIDRLQLRSWV